MNQTVTAASNATPTINTLSKRSARSDLSAIGEPFVWLMGAALVAGLAMIIGFLVLVMYAGATTFGRKPSSR